MNTEKFSWKRLVITILLIVIASAITSSLTWFLLDRAFNESVNANSQTISELERKVTFLVGQLANTNPDGSTNYTNSTYGFKLTLPSDWTKYKVLTQRMTGTERVLYFELPTSDTAFADATVSNDASYASLFSISVYTKAEWAAASPVAATKLGENDNYVFAYSHAQVAATDLSTPNSEISTIIASFKLN